MGCAPGRTIDLHSFFGEFNSHTVHEKVYNMFSFALTPEQIKKLAEWVKTLAPMPEGAIGGRLSYEFTPTSLGDVVKVKCCITNQEIDLSEYDAW